MTRRRTTVAVAVAVIVAGCSGAGFPERYESIQPSVAAETLDTTGYERLAATETNGTRQVNDRSGSWETGGRKNVTVVEHAVLFGHDSGARVVLLTSPAIRGTNESTLRSVTPPALVERAHTAFESRLPALADVEPAGNYRTTVLGSKTTITRFSATQTAVDGDGRADERTVTVHVFRVVDGSDVVVGVALVPNGEAGDAGAGDTDTGDASDSDTNAEVAAVFGNVTRPE